MKSVEIFMAGKHEDSSGNVKEWTVSDLDAIASKYNSSFHDAPAVIGHPETNDPAWGWAEKTLRRDGNVLIADFRDVAPEFAELVKKKHYPKRSISVYSDMTLKHVGFLGAKPPAVKGLRDIKFDSNEEFITIEFQENGGNTMDEKDKKIQELEVKIKELEGKLADSASSEFAEKERAKEEKIASLEAQVVRLEKEKRVKEHSDFCDSLGAKITPADRKDMMDFLEVMHSTGTYSFSEGGDQAVVDKFKNFLGKSLKDKVCFSEIATKDRAKETGAASEFSEFQNVDQSEEELNAKVENCMKQNPGLSYSEAYRKVRAN